MSDALHGKSRDGHFITCVFFFLYSPTVLLESLSSYHNKNGLCGLLWLLNNKTPSCTFPLMAMVSFWNLWKIWTKCSNLVPSLPPRVVPAQLCHPLKHWATTGICAHSHFSFLHCQKQYASWKELHRCLLNPIWGYTDELIEAFQMLKSNLNSQPCVQNHRGSIRLCFELFSNWRKLCNASARLIHVSIIKENSHSAKCRGWKCFRCQPQLSSRKKVVIIPSV